MILNLAALCVAFFSSILAIKILLPLAPHVGLVDLPDHRKKHIGNIPLIGGISIFFGALIASTLFFEQSQLLNLYFISAALLVFIGTLDDIYDLSVLSRIVFQIIVASIMVFGAGLYISNLGNLFDTGNVMIGSFGMIFTILSIIFCINAFNMIDGIDGLAGGLSIISLFSIVILNRVSGNDSFVLLPMIIIIATIPFLFYNVSRRTPRGKKIFLGDAGSMFMGLTVIWLLTMDTQGDVVSYSPVIALWIVAIPIMDMLAIVIRRTYTGNSPFRADNGHLHHILIRKGFSSRQTLAVICGMSIAMSLIGILLHLGSINDLISFVIFIIFFIFYLVWILKNTK